MRYEKPLFPMINMKVTQGYNGKYSHKGTMAIDIAGKDGGIERLYSPCTCIIKAKGTSGVYLESLYQVKCADGSVDYVNFYFFHDNNTKDLKVGQVVQQGQYFYDEGTYGRATGNHVHLIVAKGKYQGGFYNRYKHWCLKNQIEPEKVLWVKEGTVIYNNGGYNWKSTKDNFYDTTSDFRKYVVQKGDTLSKIAKKFGVNYMDIAVLNKISNPNKISVGQILNIPNR